MKADDFASVDEKLSAASLSLAGGNPELARTLAQQVLDLHPGQPQAAHVLAELDRHRPSLLERSVGGAFFLQKLRVKTAASRMEVIEPLVTGQAVLHVGCADHPVFHPASNLHLALAPLASRLDGLDADVASLDLLRRHHDGVYFTSIADAAAAGSAYDLLLVPETIEHVENPGAFLRELDTLPFDRWMLTAPCIYGLSAFPNFSHRDGGAAHGRYGDLLAQGELVEQVHPDHKFWFSPYTLANLVQASVAWAIEEVWLMHQGRQVGLVGRRR